jgi:NitT/TauT family transport system substrate-binding protein
MRATKRRWAALAVAAIWLIAACGNDGDSSDASDPDGSNGSSGGDTAEAIDFSFSYQQGTTSGLLFFVANDKGYFEDNGIAFESIPTAATTGTLVSGIASGSLDGALTALATVATTRQGGVDVKLQGAFLVTDRILIAPPDSDIPVPEDRDFEDTIKALEGKVVGVPGVGGALAIELTALLTEVGVDPDSVSFVDVQPGAPTLAAFESDSIDAAYVTTVSSDQAVDAGLVERILSAQENGPEAYGDSLLIGAMVSDEYLADNPEFSDRFQTAMEQAIEFASDPDNIDELTQIALDNEVAEFDGLQQNLLDQNYVDTLTTADADSVLEFLSTAGITTADPALTPEDVLAPASLAS